jgi:phage terminase Nu1 subunit (DNA packaging protein)
MSTPDTAAPPAARGKLVTRTEMAAIAGIAKTTLDDWVRRGCPVHRPSGRKGVPAGFDTAAVLEWRTRRT